MQRWTQEEEAQALEEYRAFVSTFRESEDFHNTWCGKWEDYEKPVFGKKPRKVRGDRNKYMKYWLENQKILNDSDWDKLDQDEYYEDEYF